MGIWLRANTEKGISQSLFIRYYSFYLLSNFDMEFIILRSYSNEISIKFVSVQKLNNYTIHN